MNRNLLPTVAAVFAIGASDANAAQVDFFRNTPNEKLEKTNKIESFQSGGHGHSEVVIDKTEIGSQTGGAGAGKKARKAGGEQEQKCRGLSCAAGEHFK